MSWSNVAIGDVVRIARTGVAPEEICAGTAYVGLEHIDSAGNFVGISSVDVGDLSSTKFKFTRRHVLFGKLRPYLKKTARPGFDGICSTDILPLEPSDYIDRDYLFHVLRRQDFVDEVSSLCSGANLPRISPNIFVAMRIPLPPMGEQRRIAEILDKADALRAKRREAIAKLDKLLHSVFVEMFGDPSENPKNWPLISLDDLSDPRDKINYGVVQPGGEFSGGVPVVRVGDIEGGSLDQSSIKRIDPEIEASYVRSRLKGNELLVSCVGSIGTVAIAPYSAVGFNIARAITRVPLSRPETRLFVLECLRTPALRRYFLEKTRTVSQPTLNVEFVKSAMVFDPPVPIVERFCEIAKKVNAKRDQQKLSMMAFEACFSSLQQRVFEGVQ